MDRLNVAGKIIYPHVTQVLIGANLVKDGPPDWHLAGAMRNRTLRALDDFANAVARERTAGAFADKREIRHHRSECSRRRAVSFAVEAVATGAVGMEEGSAVYAMHIGIFLLLRGATWS